jgi:hypothetical protein
MKVATAFGIIGLLAVTACDEAAGTATTNAAAPQGATSAAGPKKTGQLCALSTAQCQSFAKREDALLPILNKARNDRNPIDDATVQLVLDTLVRSQAEADKSCTPVTGTLKRKAQIVSASGQTAVLMGRGDSVCTLIRAN